VGKPGENLEGSRSPKICGIRSLCDQNEAYIRNGCHGLPDLRRSREFFGAVFSPVGPADRSTFPPLARRVGLRGPRVFPRWAGAWVLGWTFSPAGPARGSSIRRGFPPLGQRVGPRLDFFPRWSSAWVFGEHSISPVGPADRSTFPPLARRVGLRGPRVFPRWASAWVLGWTFSPAGPARGSSIRRGFPPLARRVGRDAHGFPPLGQRVGLVFPRWAGGQVHFSPVGPARGSRFPPLGWRVGPGQNDHDPGLARILGGRREDVGPAERVGVYIPEG